MRSLILHRKRALACFGIPYYLILSDNYAEVSGFPIKNGQSLRLSIPCEAQPMFVAIPMADGTGFTRVLTIPAGESDVEYTIVTYYNGYKTLEFSLAEGKVD